MKSGITLRTKIIAQFAVVILPLLTLLVVQSYTESRRSRAMAEMFPRHLAAAAAVRDMKAFLNGVSDAVDTGKLSTDAARAFDSAAARLGELRTLDATRDLTAVEGDLKRVGESIAKDPSIQALMPLREPINRLDKAFVAIDRDLEEGTRELMADATRSAARQWLLIRIAIATVLVVAALFIWSMIRRLTQPLNEAIRIAHAIAKGNLTNRIVVKGSDETAQLLRALAAAQEGLGALVSQVRGGASMISQSMAEIAAASNEISNRSSQLASSMTQAVASVEGVTSTVQRNVSSAEQVTAKVSESADLATAGENVVSRVIDTMVEINASGKQIEEIVAIINGVSFQTNLLALNAAIEAARAGEQGKGFAVVASEVRNLSRRSAKAAQQIQQITKTTRERVASGSKLANLAGDRMREIIASVMDIQTLMSAIVAASQEQSTAMSEITTSLSYLGSATQQNLGLISHAAHTSQAVQGNAGRLVDQVAQFQLDVSGPGRSSIILPAPVASGGSQGVATA